jgi:hypothetical protein
MDNPVDNLDLGDSAGERQAPVPTMPVLHLEGFDGPMDLLLDLAERQLIDLGKMSILALAEQFAAAMERLVDVVALERRADWLVLATRLVVLRRAKRITSCSASMRWRACAPLGSGCRAGRISGSMFLPVHTPNRPMKAATSR